MRRALALLVSTVVAAGLVAGCSSDSGGSDGSTTAPATTTTKADYADISPEAITFHPVQEIRTCEGGGIPGDTASTTEAPEPATTVPGVDGQLCYVLGPEAGNATDLRDAKVYADGVGIEVSVREDSVEALNDLFDACYEATDACPAASSEGRGYVAIVVDGQVISTPASNGPDLASTPFVITGDFDKAQATDIAAAING